MTSEVERARVAVAGCVALGVVERSTGRLVAVSLDAAEPDTGPAREQLEAGVRLQWGRSEGIREAVVFREQFVHVVLRSGGQGELALVFVCRSGGGVDATLGEARAALAEFERALPGA